MTTKNRYFSLREYREYDFHSYDSLSHFLSQRVSHGVAQILIGEQYLHALYIDRQAQTTLVHFSGALPPTGWETYPQFIGIKSGVGYEANHLLLSDPNYGLPGRLPTGWFGGSERQDLQSQLADVIHHYAKNGHEDNIVLFGASEGGFAALYYGAKLPASVTIAVNPRTDLRNMPTQYYRLAPYSFPDTPPEDLDSRLEVSIGEVFSDGAGNTVAYVQNVRDDAFFEGNLLPFLELVPGDKRVWLKLIDSGAGHTMPDSEIVSTLMGNLINGAPDWSATLRLLEYGSSPTVSEVVRVKNAMTLV